jgi:hypothetical protein
MSSEAMKDMVRTKRRLCCLRTSTSGGPPSLSIHPTTNCCSASGSRRLHRGPRSSLSGPHDHPGGGGPCSSFLRSTEVQVHARAGSHPSSLFRALSLSLPPKSKPIHLLRLPAAVALLSPFSRECAPTLHFAVTSDGQPPRLRDPLPCWSTPASCCSVLHVSRRPRSDW